MSNEPELDNTLESGAGRATLGIEGAGLDEIAVVPWPILLRRRIAKTVGIDRRWALLIVVLSGLFTVAFTITILVVSLNDVAKEFNSSVATMSWCITGPMLAFLSLIHISEPTRPY